MLLVGWPQQLSPCVGLAVMSAGREAEAEEAAWPASQLSSPGQLASGSQGSPIRCRFAQGLLKIPISSESWYPDWKSAGRFLPKVSQMQRQENHEWEERVEVVAAAAAAAGVS